MGVELRDQPDTESLHHPRRLDSVLMVLESLFRREARHADVVTGSAIAFRIAQVHNVDRMMVPQRWRCSVFRGVSLFRDSLVDIEKLRHLTVDEGIQRGAVAIGIA